MHDNAAPAAIDGIVAAIAEQRWRDALAHALEAWRQLRAPDLADLIDQIAKRCQGSERAPLHKLHPWWIWHASNYEPAMVATLAARASSGGNVVWRELQARWSGPLIDELRPMYENWAVNWACTPGLALVERFLVMLRWPDDPRTASMLADWFVEGTLNVREPGIDANRVVYTHIASQLIALQDTRVLPSITASITHPRGPSDWIRHIQHQLAMRITRELHEPPGAHVHARAVADCAARIISSTPARRTTSSVPHRVDEAELWRRVAQAPDALDARAVLGDYLIERGEPRGQLIALQLASTERGMARARRLIHWHRRSWLGDLHRILTHRGTEFRNGMLEAVCIGMHTTPEFLYDRVRGHRELATVHTVRAHYVSPERFAHFVDGIPRPVHTLEINMSEMLVALHALRPQWPIKILSLRSEARYLTENTYAQDKPRPRVFTPEYVPTGLSFEAEIELICTTMPELEEIHLDWQRSGRPGCRQALFDLPRRLPQLRRIKVVRSYYRYNAPENELAGMPWVEAI